MRHSDGRRRIKLAGYVWFLLIAVAVIAGSITLIHLGGSK